MTPKEKAEELWMKMFQKQIEITGNGDGNLCVEMALIAVNEIMHLFRFNLFYGYEKHLTYWEQVRKEIEAL